MTLRFHHRTAGCRWRGWSWLWAAVTGLPDLDMALVVIVNVCFGGQVTDDEYQAAAVNPAADS